MTIKGKIENGRLKIIDLVLYRLRVSQLKGEVEIEIKKTKNKRSLEQNAFYHGVWLPIIADWAGYANREECCKALKMRLNYFKVRKTKFGEEIIYQSTADMSVGEMAGYLQDVQILMADFGVVLPLAEYK